MLKFSLICVSGDVNTKTLCNTYLFWSRGRGEVIGNGHNVKTFFGLSNQFFFYSVLVSRKKRGQNVEPDRIHEPIFISMNTKILMNCCQSGETKKSAMWNAAKTNWTDQCEKPILPVKINQSERRNFHTPPTLNNSGVTWFWQTEWHRKTFCIEPKLRFNV